MIKAVIFDLDQTIADTKKSHYLALEAALEIRGHRKKKLDWIYGATAEQIIKHNYPEMPDEEVSKVAELKKQKLINYLKFAVLLPGARKLLDYLKDRQVKMVLVTNNTHVEIEELLSQLGLTGIFDATVGKEDAVPKPDKDPVVRAVEWVKLPLEEIIYVGDSNVDIESAKAAGIGIIITTQIHKADTNLQKVDWVVANLSEAEKVLRSLIAEVNL
jgi:phosphoglycolate phosphatase